MTTNWFFTQLKVSLCILGLMVVSIPAAPQAPPWHMPPPTCPPQCGSYQFEYNGTLTTHALDNNALYINTFPTKAELEYAVGYIQGLTYIIQHDGIAAQIQSKFLANVNKAPSAAGVAAGTAPYGNNVPQSFWNTWLPLVTASQKAAAIAYVNVYGIVAWLNLEAATLQAQINGDMERVKSIEAAYLGFAASQGINLPPNDQTAHNIFDGCNFIGGIFMVIPGLEPWGFALFMVGSLGNMYVNNCPVGACFQE